MSLFKTDRTNDFRRNLSIDEIDKFLKEGGDPNIKGIFENSLLMHLVFIDNNIDAVKYLIENFDVDIEYENRDGQSALYFSVVNGNLEILKYLISKGANINISNDKISFDIIYISLINKRFNCLEYLLNIYPNIQFDMRFALTKATYDKDVFMFLYSFIKNIQNEYKLHKYAMLYLIEYIIYYISHENEHYENKISDEIIEFLCNELNSLHS